MTKGDASQPIYLDNHATTRVDPRVVAAMLPLFDENYGNAGSTSHAFGWRAKDAVDAARESVAAAIGAAAREIVFTSGATESNNLAIHGAAQRVRRRGNHLISVTTEHKAVLDPLAKLGRRGFEVTLLPVVPDGAPNAGWLDPQQVADAIRPDTLLVSVMLANNEIGIVQSVSDIGRICRERGVLLHCDATQGVGKIPVDVGTLQVDLLSFSGHKLYGPKGIGALYVRRSAPPVRLESQLDGGGQEGGLRSGTLNVPGIVGLAAALELCRAEMSTESARLSELRGRLYAGLVNELPDVVVNGPALDLPGPCSSELRLPGNLNCHFPRVDGEALMMSMRRIAVSSGSACTSTNPEPSHVLRALGMSDDRTRASLRFGIGRFNTAAEIDAAVGEVADAVRRLRALGGAS